MDEYYIDAAYFTLRMTRKKRKNTWRSGWISRITTDGIWMLCSTA